MAMKTVLRAALLSLLLAVSPAFAPIAKAQAPWPQKPVRIVVPFPGGGSAAALCRIVGEKLSEAWKQPVIVDNRPGAGGNVGAEIAFHSAGDGYNLLCSPPGPLTINRYLYKSLPYDASKFAPITVLALVPNVITVRKDLPAGNVQELIAYA